jgi:hypothetical protein
MLFHALCPSTPQVVQRIRSGDEMQSVSDVRAALGALAEQAPEYLTLKPYGRCGTPAVWINRRANLRAVSEKLRAAAAAEVAMPVAVGTALPPAAVVRGD